MQDDFKSRYSCPKCGIRVTIASGNCPACGYIGEMDHKSIRLRSTNAAGITVTVPPPSEHDDAKNRKSRGGAGAISRYKCPRCGAKIDTAYGRCPRQQSCGYSGAMEPV